MMGMKINLTKERYVQTLQKFVNELDERFPRWKNRAWLQQDGASSHTAKVSLDWLAQNFGKRVISLKAKLEWAPHSPDLSPLDFFLWGYLKSRVYNPKPASLEELKLRISEEMKAIQPSVCHSVMENFAKRLRHCFARDGGHLEHVL